MADKSGYYSLFIKKHGSDFTIKEVHNLIARYADTMEIYVRDICSAPNTDKINLINGLILEERQRRYISTTKPAYINYLQYSQNHFISILSVCENALDVTELQELLTDVHGSPSYEYLNLGNNEAVSKEFWAKETGKLYLTGKKDFSLSSKISQYDEYLFEPECLVEFNQLLLHEPLKAKTILTAAMATLMCKINDSDSILLEDIHDAGRLTRYPLIAAEKAWMPEGRRKIYETISQVNRNDHISYSEIAEMSGIELNKITLYSQWFFNPQAYSEYFKRIKIDTLYKLNPITISDVPFFVIYKMDSQEKSIIYFFDPERFKKNRIEGIHAAFCQIVNNIIKGLHVLPDIQGLLKTNSHREVQIEAIINKFLSSCPLFKDIPKDVIGSLTEKTKINSKFLHQNIISKDQEMNKLYFIVSGKVSLEDLDMNHNVVSLTILKEQKIMGLESFGVRCVSRQNYVVATERCVYLEIGIDEIREILKDFPVFNQRIIDLALDDVYKYQKLWMMS